MKIISIILVILILSFSLCWAQKTPMEKAYGLYFQGKMAEAIKIMEEQSKENPNPQTYYFIGYAYYKMKKMDMAKEYFDKAYQLESFYKPVISKDRKE